MAGIDAGEVVDEVGAADQPEDEDQAEEGAEQTEPTEEESEAEGSETDESGGDPEEVVVTIGDEPEPEAAQEETPVIRDIRASQKQAVRALREAERKVRERDEEIARLKGGGKAEATEVGEKPTLKACDYDEDEFGKQLDAWHQRKLAADTEQRKREEADRAAKAAWQARLDAYGKAKAALKVKDYEDAEAEAQAVLSVTQQGVILTGAERPELLIYALGKNPKRLKELAALGDPVKFAFAVAKLEDQLKVTPRKTAPLPERTVRGSGATVGAVAISSKRLDELQKKAQESGDYTEYLRAKAQAREKQRA